MSFSSKLKEELSRQISPARHCRIAEIAAIISLCGKITHSPQGEVRVKIHTENVAVARKYFTLLKKTFNISTDVSIRRNAYLHKNRSYEVTISDKTAAVRVLLAAKLLDENGIIGENLRTVKNLVFLQSCCKRAFIRGAFLSCGSISDPEKFYHFEIVCGTLEKAEQLKAVIGAFELEAKIVRRKRHFVVYIKEGNQIVDILNVMEAPVTLMELENVRILKDMRNSVNRQVNCETANISKTVSAAVKQIEDIEYIKDTIGFEGLPDSLQVIAEERLKRRSATLKELGEALDPPVGKSGVNHRLRKLCDLAAGLRNEQ